MNPCLVVRAVMMALTAMTTLSACATRLTCRREVAVIRLAKPGPQAELRTTEAERVAAYLPQDPRRSGLIVTHVDAIHHRAVCGNPLLLTFCTFGLVPTHLPSGADITVTGSAHGRTETRQYSVDLQSSCSLWHSFIPASHDDKTMARALLDAIDRDQRSPSLGMPVKPRRKDDKKMGRQKMIQSWIQAPAAGENRIGTGRGRRSLK